MNEISVWSGLLLYGFAATALPPPPLPAPPMVVEGRNATSDVQARDVQANSGPVLHTHHVWRARHRR
ncbi:MAG: hypothetical protein K0R27_3526 [Xanthobacteraceae bacterium]|jgi:hypothetical protein|nr:hypothetical protein [Xanthobacteraceae bacterium]